MKTLTLIATILLLVGCGKDAEVTLPVAPTFTCSVDNQELQSIVTCSDGTEITIDKEDPIGIAINAYHSDDLDVCESGSGTVIEYGYDENDNGILDDSEIADAEIVCDEKKGGKKCGHKEGTGEDCHEDDK